MGTPSTGTSLTDTLERSRAAQILVSRVGKLALRVTTAGERRDLVVAEPIISIGSHPSSVVVVDDPAVSRIHCELEVKGTGVMLRDGGSKNGTWLDDVRINEIWLPIGSTVCVGNSSIALRDVVAVDVPVSTRKCFGGLYGTGTQMGALFAKLERIAAADLDVLVVGETGTGKELVARGIHQNSARRDGPFVVVDCTMLNSGIAESILFGHRKGSFTGASHDQPGLVEQAHGGTLFFDEIGELPADLQPKLLRCLERREFRRIGDPDHGYSRLDARVIAATNRNLPRMMSSGAFREDLYYRLVTVRVDIPSLDERGAENVSLLSDLFVERLSKERGAQLRIDRGAYERLEHHHWRGNVRELYNTLRAAAMMVESPCIRACDIALVDRSEATDEPGHARSAGAMEDLLQMSWEQARKRFGKIYADHRVTESKGNQSRAARRAGMSRNAFRALLKHP